MTWEPSGTIRLDWGRLQVVTNSQDVTFFRDKICQVSEWGSAEPFGDTALIVRFPQITPFEEPGAGDLSWLREGRGLELHLIRPDGTRPVLWTGVIMSTEGHHDEQTSWLDVHCKGAVVRYDNVLKQPGFEYRARDIGFAIAGAFNRIMAHMCIPVTTGIMTRQRGAWTPTATGYVQDLLGLATTAGGGQWTVAQNRWAPVIQLKDTTTVHATLTVGTPGLTVDLAYDLTGAPNVIYGEGISPDGCFPAEVPVSAEGILSGFTYEWSGDLVRLRTRNGHDLAATPNHPVLTTRGWVAAGLLQVGDKLFSRSVAEGDLLGKPDVHDRPAAIGQVVGALEKMGTVERVATGVVEFHGDRPNREVKVVRPHRDLPSHLEALELEPLRQPLLALADEGAHRSSYSSGSVERFDGVPHVQAVGGHDVGDRVVADAHVLGDAQSGLSRLVAVANRLLVKASRSLTLLGARDGRSVGCSVSSGHSSDHPLVPGAHDTSVFEPQADDLGGHAEAVRDALGRLPADVTLDDVVHVEREPWSGHVYNLETVSGGYFASGIVVHNSHWRNTKYPNFFPDGVPAFPLSTGSVFTPGSSTTGFQEFADEMRDHGYNTIVSGDTYNSADEDEVRDAQRRAGATVDGIVGAQTWNAIFQTGDNVGDLEGAYCAPLAYLPAVEQFLYNARGAKIGPNPAFDHTVQRVERYENFGEGITKQQAIISARAELAKISDPGYVGTLTLRVDPEEISRFELRGGMNILLKSYQGGDRLLHIAEVSVNWQSLSVTLSVDTHARDAMTRAAVWSRNADAATDPVRRTLPQRRRSRQTQDNKVVWDSESGAGKVPKANLQGGYWSVFRIPGGQQGTVGETVLTTSSPASRFVAAVFGKPVTPADMIRLVAANPLGHTDPWSDYSDDLVDAGYLVGWGDQDQAMGYYPKVQGQDGATVTGRFEERSGWAYESLRPPWLWVAIYAADSCQIVGQLYEEPDA